MKNVLIMVGLVLVLAMASVANAASTNTFNVSITVDYISVDLQNVSGTGVYAGWNIGQVEAARVRTMYGGEGIKVVNNSNVPVDVNTYVNSGSGWNLGGSAYIDQFALKAVTFDTVQDTESPVSMTNAVQIVQQDGGGNTIKASLAVDAATYVYYQFEAPTTVNSRDAKTVGITVAAVLAA
jgi:hypothetical protein